MFFPHEKEYLLGAEETAFPYRKYAKQVWQRTESIAQTATEIWLIGYSVGETDLPYTLRILRAAKNSERIVIQGPHPTGIVERLKARAQTSAQESRAFRKAFDFIHPPRTPLFLPARILRRPALGLFARSFAQSAFQQSVRPFTFPRELALNGLPQTFTVAFYGSKVVCRKTAQFPETARKSICS